MQLRDYQRKTVNECVSLLKPFLRGSSSEIPKLLVVSPTGSGKTVMMAEVARRAADAGYRCGAFAHRVELVDQLKKRTGIPVVLTPQSKEFDESVDIWFYDEAHHYAAAEWSYAVKHGKPIVGFTATPERADGKPMGNRFDHMIVAAHPDELHQQGHLVPVEIVEPQFDVSAGSIAGSPAEVWLAHARGKRGFVFCRSVKHCYEVCEEFAAVGLKAFVVEGSMDKDQRADAIQAFRDGELDALINVYILTEGLDVPEAEVCMFARNCGHASTFLQMAGRVLRPAPGKKMATLIDLTGVLSIHGSPLERRIYSLSKGIERECEVPIAQCPRCGWSKRGSFRICQKCFFQVPSDFEFIPPIDSVPLRTRWAGSETPEEDRLEEWRRLRATGAPMEVCIRDYKKLFHRVPKLTHEEMCSLFSWFHNQGNNRGHKHGYAFARFRSALGIQPPKEVIKQCLFTRR